MPEPPRFRHPLWVYFFLGLDILGLAVFLFGFRPGWFGMDRSYVIGYVQVFVFLVGLAMVLAFSYATATLLRPEGQPLTIREDLGGRFAATGYVLAAFAGTADLVGLGSQPLPGTPYFGLLQSSGVVVGLSVMLAGILMYLPGRAAPQK